MVVPECFKDDNASQWKSGKFFTIIFDVFLSDVACHILTKLHPNGSTDGKVLTSYRFLQRATIELEIYSGFGFSDSTKIRSRDNFPTPLT